jgi:hypothetical protein
LSDTAVVSEDSRTILGLLGPPNAPTNLPLTCVKAYLWDQAKISDESGIFSATITIPGSNGSEIIPETTYEILRNDCIYAFLTAIDQSYNVYKRATVVTVNGANTAADIAVLGLATGATAIGGNTGRILSGIAAGLTGAKSTINADLLYNSSITTIVLQMDGDRADIRSQIMQRIQNGTRAAPDSSSKPLLDQTAKAAAASAASAVQPTVVSGTVSKDITVNNPAAANAPASTTRIVTTRTIGNTRAPSTSRAARGKKSPVQLGSDISRGQGYLPYSMYEAANDLLQYYESGTFVHALVSLQAQAGAHVTNCKQQVKNLKTTGTPTGVSTDPTISGDPTVSPATGTKSGQTGQASAC